MILHIDEIRRNNLKNYLKEHKSDFKSLTDFAKRMGLHASNLSPILNGERRFTDQLAEKLEQKLNLSRGALSALSNPINLVIPFYSNKNSGFSLTGEYFDLNRELVSPEHQNCPKLFAVKPNIHIDQEAMSKSIGDEKILIFNSVDTQLVSGKIYLLRIGKNLLLRRCQIERDNIIFDSDKPEIYSKIIHSGQDVAVLGRLIYSGCLESY